MAQKIVVGMSGGVDSAVSAYLLKKQGYDVVGVFMRNWEEKDEDGNCTSMEDFEDVKQICTQLEIPYYSVNFVKEYWDNVFKLFLEEYKNGRTPNPDILCNKEIKFKMFLNTAMSLGADKMATGHYCGVKEEDGIFYLTRAADQNKDQTYFLCALNQEQLSKAMFPLTDIEKPEIRRLAKEANIHIAEKKDSTGICFIGERNFKEFLSGYLPAKPGNMVDPEGNVLGRHDGLMYYTLGQRKGLGIGGIGNGEPWFVGAKDLEKNELIVVQGEQHPLLYSKSLITEEFNWISGKPKSFPYECTAKFRYRQADQEVIVEEYDEKRLHIRFKKPQKAVTTGQSAVLYDGDICLGGGVIEKVIQ